MTTTKPRVEVAPFDAREAVVMLATWAVVAVLLGGLAVVAGPMIPGVGAGVLLTLGGMFAVGALVVQALRSR